MVLVCELAVAFAGFTAIVSVLHYTTDELERSLLELRLRQMLELSLLTIAGGLLPFLLRQIGADESTSWRLAGALLGLAGCFMLWIQGSRNFAVRVRRAASYNFAYAVFLFFLGAIATISFFVTASGVFRSDGVYVLGVTLVLVIAGLQFLRAATLVVRTSALRPASSNGE